MGVGCWVLLVPSLSSVTRDQNLSRLNFWGLGGIFAMAKLQKSPIQLLLSLWLCSILLQDATTTAARILLPTNSKIRSKTEDSVGSRDNTGGFQINNGNMEFLHEESGGRRGEEGGGKSVVGTNSRPLIGILSQPSCAESATEADWTSNRSCIAASYVKFVESAGARAVPLLYNEPEETLIKVGFCQSSQQLHFLCLLLLFSWSSLGKSKQPINAKTGTKQDHVSLLIYPMEVNKTLRIPLGLGGTN